MCTQKTIDTILKNENSEIIADFLLYLAGVYKRPVGIWENRLITFFYPFIEALTYLRDHKDIPFDINKVLDLSSLNELIKLAENDNLPEEIRKPLSNYIEILPSYIKNPNPDNEKAIEFHSYIIMQIFPIKAYINK